MAYSLDAFCRDCRAALTADTSPGGRELPLLVLSKDGLRTPAEARHCAVLFASAGQVLFVPSQKSATSHTPAEAWHSVVFGST